MQCLQEARHLELKLLARIDDQCPIADLKYVIRSIMKRLQTLKSHYNTETTSELSVAERFVLTSLLQADDPPKTDLIAVIKSLNKDLLALEKCSNNNVDTPVARTAITRPLEESLPASSDSQKRARVSSSSLL
jgi:hypothetical protein